MKQTITKYNVTKQIAKILEGTGTIDERYDQARVLINNCLLKDENKKPFVDLADDWYKSKKLAVEISAVLDQANALSHSSITTAYRKASDMIRFADIERSEKERLYSLCNEWADEMEKTHDAIQTILNAEYSREV